MLTSTNGVGVVVKYYYVVFVVVFCSFGVEDVVMLLYLCVCVHFGFLDVDEVLLNGVMLYDGK